ncbi:MAG: YhcG family protein [Muribaculaceae bacterium]
MTNKENKPAFVKRDAIVSGKEYAQLLGTLKERYRKSQIKAAVKVNTAMLEYYWEMGRDISRLYANARYGSAFFDCLSLDLKAEFPDQTGFSTANIRYAKRWYEFYSQSNTNLHQAGEDFKIVNRQQLADDLEMPMEFGQIPWKHHVLIFTKSKSVAEALFYIDKTIANGWSRAELESEIDFNLYGKQGAAITNFEEKMPAPYSGLAKAILKSPYDFGFVDRRIKNERDLENELERNITRFLLELGQGFAYVGRQMELKMPGGQTFIPDMIFYHTRLKAYVVVELKIVPFIPDFAGKINFYVTAVDELMRQDDDNPTIGLLICKSKDNTVVEWSFRGMTQPLGVAEFKPLIAKMTEMLPSESDLQHIIDTYDEDTEEL